MIITLPSCFQWLLDILKTVSIFWVNWWIAVTHWIKTWNRNKLKRSPHAAQWSQVLEKHLVGGFRSLTSISFWECQMWVDWLSSLVKCIIWQWLIHHTTYLKLVVSPAVNEHQAFKVTTDYIIGPRHQPCTVFSCLVCQLIIYSMCFWKSINQQTTNYFDNEIFNIVNIAVLCLYHCKVNLVWIAGTRGNIRYHFSLFTILQTKYLIYWLRKSLVFIPDMYTVYINFTQTIHIIF